MEATKLNINYMEQRRSCEPNSCSADQLVGLRRGLQDAEAVILCNLREFNPLCLQKILKTIINDNST
jgi:hypothetical protein